MPSYYGTCPNAKESLILFEAVKMGSIPTVSDRLSEEERKEIVSGAIYIWDEKQSPMRRWTDGRNWSNSRVVGDFLEYRESIPDTTPGRAGRYCIKPYGLRKRSICLSAYGGSSLRLVAYFTYSDIKSGNLKPPSADPLFADIVRKLESNPSEQENLQILASMRRRKRSKGNNDPMKSGRWESEGSTHHPSSSLSAHPPPVRPAPSIGVPANPNGGNFEQFLRNNKVPAQNNTLGFPLVPPPFFESYRTVTSSAPVHSMPTLSDTTDKKALVLPSPVWRPLNMHSEDRRALSLLNSPPVYRDPSGRSHSTFEKPLSSRHYDIFGSGMKQQPANTQPSQ